MVQEVDLLGAEWKKNYIGVFVCKELKRIELISLHHYNAVIVVAAAADDTYKKKKKKIYSFIDLLKAQGHLRAFH